MLPACAHYHDPDLLKAEPADSDDTSIWRPLDSPYLSSLAEAFTAAGLKSIDELRKRTERWTTKELAAGFAYLEHKPQGEWSADDWSLLVDWWLQRWLPADMAPAYAEWLVLKSTLLGRIQAALARRAVAPEDAATAVAKLPMSIDAALEAGYSLSPRQLAIIEFGKVRCADAIVGVSDALRGRLKRAILSHQANALLGNRQDSLEFQLRDAFGSANRDWRRIAVTETVENANQGAIAFFGPGKKIVRHEFYHGACLWCRNLNGKVFTVVAPDAKDKDGQTQVWLGKTNIGRSIAPRRRTVGGLVERTESERFWPAAGVQHVHCRGWWEPEQTPKSSGDVAFDARVDAILRGKK